MSIKAIGYGMPAEDFYQSVRLPIERENNLRYELRQYLSGTKHIMDSRVENLFGLFSTVGEHIMIFPTHTDREKWYRRGYLGLEIVGRARYINEPIEPYLVYMDGNGIEVETPRGDPALIPGIPAIMRWWLLRYGVFDLTGIAKLRPMMVEGIP